MVTRIGTGYACTNVPTVCVNIKLTPRSALRGSALPYIGRNVRKVDMCNINVEKCSTLWPTRNIKTCLQQVFDSAAATTTRALLGFA